MRFKQKYVHPAIIFFLVYLFGTVIFGAGVIAARYGYAYLNYLFPRIFPLFSAVSQKAEYEKYLCLVNTVGIFFSFLIINFFTIRFDNNKFELIVSKTDGLYTIKDGSRLYFKEFLVSDIIGSLFFPALLVILAYVIPKIEQTTVPVVNLLIGILESVLWLGNSFAEYYSLVDAVLLSLIFATLARLLVIPHALKHWRGAWLSGSIA